MTLSTGTKFAHYEITSQLGKGGMGEVYQAKDTKLGRDVAIKVLPEEFARDTDRVARFQREAKLLASLNHPNIASIYGLEESDGTHFLVLELIEGQTLDDRIKSGAIPVEEALKLALQIAEALEAAHEKGVIHRDLKPANIKVTPDGKVKVLDFGLAKAFAGGQEEMIPSDSPTLSVAATQKGVILGTAAYMSPEQARGKPVDKRTDIWAFGCVLYEMLAGRQLFSEDTVSDTLASVLKTEPEWQSLPPNLHPRIRFLLERCLKKEPKNRYSGISDARVEIQEVLDDPSGVLAQPVSPLESRMRLWQMLPLLGATLILGAIIAGVAVWVLKPSPSTEPRQITRFDYNLPDSHQFGDLLERAIAISPDGSRFVYKTNKGLYFRSVAELDSRLIPGTEGAQKPFFSPDGQWIGFVSETARKLKKISINGGAPVSIADVASTGFLSWGADAAIVYAGSGGVMRVPANGGNPEPLLKGEGAHYAPQILPDGKTMMYTTGPEPYRIMLQSLESGEQKVLLEGDTAQYLPTGHIVYGLDNTLFAVSFDLDRLETIGGQIPVVEGVLRAGGAPQYAVSDSGALIYIPGTAVAAAQRTLVWVDRNGKEDSLSAPSDGYFNPRISPDGTRVALEILTGENRHIWIRGLTRETMTRLTYSGNRNTNPVWSPDGKRIGFSSSSARTTRAIFCKAADGAGEIEELCSAPTAALTPQSWSSDGEIMVLVEWGGSTQGISGLSMEGDYQKSLLLQDEKYGQRQPQISPDGKWLAYSSNESGQEEVYVRPFPEVNKWKKIVSIGGGNSPLWSPDGRELFYRNVDSVMAVAVETEPTFRLQKPVRLFRGTYVRWNSSTELHPWDIHPDGKRFLMIKPPETPEDDSIPDGGPRKINIVLNWFEELKERVPVP